MIQINYVDCVTTLHYFSNIYLMDSINIVEPDNEFNFDKISLGSLSIVSGGSYFTRLFFNNKTLYIQTPKSLTKQGFVKSGKKIYCDLMFTNNDEMFVNWIENLETTCQKLLHKHSDNWFSSENKLELNDIESAFTSPLKLFKSGRFYLIRANAKPAIKIFDEKNGVASIESVNSETNIISVIEVQGVKFTSKNFQIEMELKQCIMVRSDPFENCLIKRAPKNNANSVNDVSDVDAADADDDDAFNAETEKIFQTNQTNVATIAPAMEIRIAPAFATVPATSVSEDVVDDAILNDTNTSAIAMVVDNSAAARVNAKEAIDNGELDSFLKECMTNDIEDDDNVDNASINRADETFDDATSLTASKDPDKITDLNTKLNSQVHSLVSASASTSQTLKIENVNDISDNVKIDSIEILDNSITDLTDLTESFNIVVDNVDNSLETIVLKKPNQVYYEIYKEARKKAKECKKNALLAYLEAKNIKKTYMLDDTDNDSDESVNSDASDDVNNDDATSDDDDDTDFDDLSVSDFND